MAGRSEKRKDAGRGTAVKSYGPWDVVDGKCNARLRSKKGLCRHESGWGTTHSGIGRCECHGGASPSHLKHAQKIMATDAVARFSLSREIGAHEALLEELHRTVGRVDLFEGVIDGKDLQDLVWGITVDQLGSGQEGAGTFTKWEAAPSIWLKLDQWERKHLVAVSKTVIECCIAEHRAEVDDATAQVLFVILAEILKAYGIDITEGEVSKVAGEKIRLLTAGGEEEGE